MRKTNLVTINIRCDKPIPTKPYVLVKAEDGDYFYAMTLDEMFANEKAIVAEDKKNAELLASKFDQYKKDMDGKYASFIKSYQASNAKIIGLVDQVVNGDSSSGVK